MTAPKPPRPPKKRAPTPKRVYVLVDREGRAQTAGNVRGKVVDACIFRGDRVFTYQLVYTAEFFTAEKAKKQRKKGGGK